MCLTPPEEIRERFMVRAMLLATIVPLGVAAMSLVPPARLPAPLSPADGVHTFTYDSVQRRLPLIVEAVITNNPSYSAELVEDLRTFAAEIAAGKPISPLKSTDGGWTDFLSPMIAGGSTWFTAPWWASENYFYKRMLELTDPRTDLADPFAKQKTDSLAAAASAFERMLAQGLAETTDLAPLVLTSLWGNVADLSVSAGSVLVAPEDASSGSSLGSSMMLADDTPALCDALHRCSGKPIIVVLDNCGLEAVSDLLLVDGLLRIVRPSKVTLHVKDRPVFVSDVTIPDVQPTIDWLAGHGGAQVAARLSAALADGSLQVSAPDFYTSALPFWSMPAALAEEFGAAALVLTKGDANYRRLLDDRHWAHDTRSVPSHHGLGPRQSLTPTGDGGRLASLSPSLPPVSCAQLWRADELLAHEHRLAAHMQVRGAGGRRPGRRVGGQGGAPGELADRRPLWYGPASRGAVSEA